MTSLKTSPLKIGAGIVAFGPDPVIFRRLIEAIIPDIDQVFIMVNAVIDASLKNSISQDFPDIVFIESDYNLGVGEALNILCLAAILQNCRSIILFDQDSRPSSKLVTDLVQHQGALKDKGEHVAIIAPRLISPKTEMFDYKEPRYTYLSKDLPEIHRVGFLPTSGSLLDLNIFLKVGKFRADYFIDSIDLEWCFRANYQGYHCWLAQNCCMEHTIGSGMIQAKILRLRTPRQRSFRIFSYIRNSVYGLRLKHVPLRWKIIQGLYLPVQILMFYADSKFNTTILKTAFKAVWHGLKGHLGPPPHTPFSYDALNAGTKVHKGHEAASNPIEP